VDPANRQLLLAYARRCVEAAARGEAPPPLPDPPPELQVRGAAFVTLRSAGELRGCIGHTEAARPLWESVREMAEAAATRDPRFEPVRRDEPVQVELSLLSPMVRIRPDEVQVGLHGLYLKWGPHAGLLLPQVAVEWRWDRERFLAETCRKAGLPHDEWRNPAVELWAFTAEKLAE
jgi:AmmeMemoRadiSam system protein A